MLSTWKTTGSHWKEHWLDCLHSLEYVSVSFSASPDPNGNITRLFREQDAFEESIQTLKDCLVESNGCFDRFRTLIQERDSAGFGQLFEAGTRKVGQPNLRYLNLDLTSSNHYQDAALIRWICRGWKSLREIHLGRTYLASNTTMKVMAALCCDQLARVECAIHELSVLDRDISRAISEYEFYHLVDLDVSYSCLERF